MSDQIHDTEAFRDTIGTVDKDGKRIWAYPKKVAGKFYQYRTYLSWVLLAVLFGMPFIKVNGDPFMLFNVLERKFILFSIVFTPQDLHLFALAMITLMVFVILFTVIFGRLFCGWVCPQTIFMEMVFRKIEYWIEGDFNQQMSLNNGPWTFTKVWKKTLKLGLFYLISVFIANIFLSYIIGSDAVLQIISEPIAQHLSGFITLLIFSFIFFFVFSWLREQVCTTICPYGRLQGVLLNPDSIVVAYDFVRGEPRGKFKKKREEEETSVTAKQGDCIDCGLCVKVCPTRIDIRNGTQLECTNCTACMDACDEMMIKVDREPGLIRYDSMVGIKEKTKRIFTPRVIGYSIVLTLLISVQVFLFATRSKVEAIVLRTPGMLYQEADATHVTNLYNYQVVNKTSNILQKTEFKVKDNLGTVKLVGTIQPIGKQAIAKGSFFVEIETSTLTQKTNNIAIEVYVDDELIEVVETNFLGPEK